LISTGSGSDQGFGFMGGFLFVIGRPGVMLANVCHLEQEGIQACSLASGAEGLLVHVRGTRGDNHPRQFFFFDICFDEFLTQTRAHELIVTSNRHIRFFFRPMCDLFYVNGLGDIGATVAYINPNFFTHGFLSGSEF
jgi:hypothetical protein